jgi:predicted nucleic-acid-binding protein
MIAADTNLVVRHLTHDDPGQTAMVDRIFGEAEARGEPIFLGHLVLSEVCWTLASSYRFSKVAIVTALQALLDDGAFLVEGRETVAEALGQYKKGRAQFLDYLIGEIARQAGAAVTVTFDRRLARARGFTIAK